MYLIYYIYYYYSLIENSDSATFNEKNFSSEKVEIMF